MPYVCRRCVTAPTSSQRHADSLLGFVLTTHPKADHMAHPKATTMEKIRHVSQGTYHADSAIQYYSEDSESAESPVHTANAQRSCNGPVSLAG